MMSKRSETRAAEILEGYMKGLASGQTPDVQELLRRCPDDMKDDLVLAIEGITFVSRNYSPLLVSESLVEKTVSRFTQVAERRKRAEEARGRLAQQGQTALRAEGILPFLESVLAVRVARDQLPSREPAPAVLYRNIEAGLQRGPIDALRAAMAERQATDHARLLLARFGASFPPVDPRQVAEWLGVLVIEQETEGCDGCVLMEGDAAGILVNTGIRSEARKRFTVAHELGHCDLHKERIAFQRESLREIEEAATAGMEAEANAYAAELLMPGDWVRPSFAHIVPGLKAIEDIADQYMVSLTAAAIRLAKLSDYACAAVCTIGGTIKWGKSVV